MEAEKEQYKEPDLNERRIRLNALAKSLITKRDEAVKFRAASGVERRWREDQQAFDSLEEAGRPNMVDYAAGEASARGGGGPVRSRVSVNIIRPKCETAEGRFSDILFPTDDRNWGLKETPVPELVKGLTDDRPVINTETQQPLVDDKGVEAKTSDVARTQLDVAQDKMRAMETEIEDQLTECNYNSECRKVARDAIRYGTGVLKGPLVVKRTRKAWIPQSDGERTVHVMQTVENPEPESKRVDFWNVYPAPESDEDVNRCPYVWEVGDITPRELAALVGVEGYFEDQIKAVLEEDPQRTHVGTSRDKKFHEVQQQAKEKGSSYERWEYHGDVSRDDLEALDCDCGDLEGASLSVCVVFANERPIKIQLNVLDTGDLIYDFFHWTEVSGSPWGTGVVRASIWQQRIIIAAWRAMMDNARDSAGANAVVGKGLAPVDGVWELTGKKIWRATGDEVDVRKMFAQFQVASNQPELQAIIEMSLKFLDMETNLPMMFQGEKAEMPETLGATNIMVDSNNVSLRGRVKLWDDKITDRQITRFYHWNMQYNENSDIKGDYNVDARGTSVLLVRDQQAKSLIELMALRGDPKVDAEVSWGKAVQELFKALKLDVLKSDDEKKQEEKAQAEQPQQQDPALDAANIRAQAELQKAQLVQQSDMTELEYKAGMAEVERAHEMKMKEMDLQMKMMEFADKRNLKLDEIKADLTKEASKQNLMREMADKKTAELTTPPIEPPGRARKDVRMQSE